jgi:hypothetical protein
LLFLSLTATPQEVELNKLEWWMAISDGTDVVQPLDKREICGEVVGGRISDNLLAFYGGIFSDTV